MELVLANQPEVSSHYIDDFIIGLKVSNLEFDSEDLRSFGITDNNQIEKAVDRSRFACSLAGLDLSWHFRQYYLGTTHGVRHAWKMSQLAFLLAFLKADPLNSDTAFLQTEIAEDLLENLDLKII